MEKKELGYLNALKGLAILAVTMVHTGAAGLPGIWGKIGVSGAKGVQMYFVISGILAFKSLSGYFPDRKFDAKMILKWYLNKLIRLVPLYYFAIVISMLTKSWSPYWLGTEGHVTKKNLLAHIFLIHGFFPHYTDSVLGVDWYLGCLWIFLLVSPLLFWLVDSFEKSVLFLMAVYLINPLISSEIAKLLPVDTDPDIYITFINSFGPHAQFLVFSTGIMLFYLMEIIRTKEIKCKKALSYGLLIFAVILLYDQVRNAPGLLNLSNQEIFGLFFGLIIISQAIHASVIIDNPFFRLYGKYSYGIYLFQFIWINFYERHINYNGPFDWTVKFIASISALLLISFLITRFFEKPVTTWLSARL